MKIRNICIDGFGVWHDRRWEGLSDGINVFLGPNEAGKTTLMSFVRSILFGFERRAHPRRYEPLDGGDYGGWLDVSGDGGDIRVERRGGRHVRGSVALRALGPEGIAGDVAAAAGEDDAEGALERMLGGTTRTLYYNVFAFGLEELEQFRTLEENEVAAHISGAGMGVGAERWSRVWKDLEDRRSSLYLPKGQNSTLNQALRELAGVREELDRTASEPEEYFRVREVREELDAEAAALEDEIRTLGARIEHYRKVREAEPYRLRRQALEAELRGLEAIDSFPEGGADRLNFLFDQRRSLEAGLARVRDETARIRAERQGLARQYTPQDLIRSSRMVESLRLLLPRRDASEEVIAGATGRRDAALLERQRLETRQAALAPPSPAAMLLLAGLVVLGAMGVVLAGYAAGRWVASALLVVLALWYYSRLRSAGRLDDDIRAAGESLAAREADLERVSADGRQVAASIERLAGRSDFSHVDLERESLRVQELAGIAERVRSIEARLESADHEAERLRIQIEEVDRKVRDLFAQGGAASESEFFRRAGIFRRRRELTAELERIPPAVVERPAGVAELPDAPACREASDHYERSVARLREVRTGIGRIEERLATLSRSEQRSRARLRQESVMARIDEASGKWAVLTLCRTLLADTRRIYETERQPEVLRHASDFFSRMTAGSWSRVISPLDSGILVESADGARLSPENLSRGTAEQLYLAMRLALVREYSRHVASLPVVLDDIFVNFDPERTRRSVGAMGELARTHQVLVFTCHPHLVRTIEEIVPGTKIYPLQ